MRFGRDTAILSAFVEFDNGTALHAAATGASREYELVCEAGIIRIQNDGESLYVRKSEEQDRAYDPIGVEPVTPWSGTERKVRELVAAIKTGTPGVSNLRQRCWGRRSDSVFMSRIYRVELLSIRQFRIESVGCRVGDLYVQNDFGKWQKLKGAQLRNSTMLGKIQKWGNSEGLRFTKALLQEAQINVSDEVNISVQNGRIIVEPATKVRGKYDLKELVSKIPKSIKRKNWTGVSLLERKFGKCPNIFWRKLLNSYLTKF